MIKTPNLNLPIYDNASKDTFRVADWNEANTNIDYVFGELKKNPNVNAIDITARQDIINNHRSVTSQLDNIVTDTANNLNLKANKNDMQIELAKKRNIATPITMSDLTTEVKQAMTGGSVAVVGVNSVGNENLKTKSVSIDKMSDSLTDSLLKSNARIIQVDTLKEVKALNGATVDGNKLVIPSNTTGHLSYIRYTTEYKFDKDQLIKIAIMVNQSNLDTTSYTGTLLLTRNGVFQVVEPEKINITRLDNNNYLIQGEFSVKNGDVNPVLSCQLASHTASSNETVITISNAFICQDITTVINDILTSKSEADFTLGNILSKENSAITYANTFKTVTPLNGATVNGESLVIPSNVTGALSYIRYGSDNVFNCNQTIKTVSIVNQSNFHKINYTGALLVTRNGQTQVVQPTTANVVQLTPNKYSVTMLFSILKNDSSPIISVQIASHIASDGETIVKIDNTYICQDLNSIINDLYYLDTTNKYSETELLGWRGIDEITLNIDNSINERLIINIPQSMNNTLRAYAISGSKTVQCFFTNLITNATTKEAVYAGVYEISTPYNTVKLTRTDSNQILGGNNYSIVKRVKNYDKTPLIKSNLTSRLNFVKPTTNELTYPNTSFMNVKDGCLYGFKKENNIISFVKTDTSYSNISVLSTVPSETNYPKHLEVCGDKFIIITATGKVYKTDGVSYTKVLDITRHIYDWGGFQQLDCYKNIVLVSEYRLPIEHNNPWDGGGGKLYLSTDYGDTFKVIFDIPVNLGVDVRNQHIHSIKYDEYEDIIWLVTGDGLGKQAIFWSMDLGVTWNQTNYVKSAVQFTAIYPMKDCVLFGTDARLTGICRYNRPSCGTIDKTELNLDMPLVLGEKLGLSNSSSVPVASRGAINKKQGILAFGYMISDDTQASITGDMFKKSQVWLTDGVKFIMSFITNDIISIGCNGCFYDEYNNKFIIRIGNHIGRIGIIDCSNITY